MLNISVEDENLWGRFFFCFFFFEQKTYGEGRFWIQCEKGKFKMNQAVPWELISWKANATKHN